jgi:hypothetical protein
MHDNADVMTENLAQNLVYLPRIALALQRTAELALNHAMTDYGVFLWSLVLGG